MRENRKKLNQRVEKNRTGFKSKHLGFLEALVINQITICMLRNVLSHTLGMPTPR